MIEKIKSIAEEIFPMVVSWREHLHMHPELSFEEENTAAFIQSILDEIGINYKSNVAGHGVVAEIKGSGSGDGKVALRGDIDALPIQEENDVPYRSQVPGVMHACGHDVHTSSLLGTALILHRLKEEWSGEVRLIFQPSEERLPGGASLMIKEGVLKNPTPDCILGQHVHPELEAGKIGFKEGMFMASADEIYVTIEGKGGHGAMPHKCVDPIVIASEVILALQQVVSRKAPPTIPTVLTFGKIESDGGATNIITDRVFLQGTLRTLDEEWRAEAHNWIEKMISSICDGHGGSAVVEIRKGYPFLKNDESVTKTIREAAIDYYGKDNVVDLPLRMTSEDFAFYTQEIPASFYRIGVSNAAKGINSSVHTPSFDIDKEALRWSTGFMAYAALKSLSED